MKYLSWFLLTNLVTTIYCSEKDPQTKTSIYLVRTIAQNQHRRALRAMYPVIVQEKTFYLEMKKKLQ